MRSKVERHSEEAEKAVRDIRRSNSSNAADGDDEPPLGCCRWGRGNLRRSRLYVFGLIGLFAGFYLFVAFARSFFRSSRLEYAWLCSAWNELFDIW